MGPEHAEKMSGSRWMFHRNNMRVIKVKKEEVQTYLNTGWEFGRSIK